MRGAPSLPRFLRQDGDFDFLYRRARHPPIARVIRKMAGEISGLANDKDKKKSLLGLFG